MARIRTIKPEFWTSEQIMSVSRDARLLFIGLWNFCDDGGNHPASIITLKAQVFPGDDIDSPTVRRLVAELSSTGLISEYQIGDKSYWHVTGWHHQKIEKPNFKYPAFSKDYEKPYKENSQNSTTPRRPLVDHSPPEGKGCIKEVERKSVKTHSNAHAYTPEFENFWKIYPPNEGSKLKAFESYQKSIKTGVDHGRIESGARAYAESIRRKAGEKRFTAHAATWLNQRRWESDYSAEPENNPATGKSKWTSEGDRLAEKYLAQGDRES